MAAMVPNFCPSRMFQCVMNVFCLGVRFEIKCFLQIFERNFEGVAIRQEGVRHQKTILKYQKKGKLFKGSENYSSTYKQN